MELEVVMAVEVTGVEAEVEVKHDVFLDLGPFSALFCFRL